MEEQTGSYRVLVGKFEAKKPLADPGEEGKIG